MVLREQLGEQRAARRMVAAMCNLLPYGTDAFFFNVVSADQTERSTVPACPSKTGDV